jgi:hypothetical protein
LIARPIKFRSPEKGSPFMEVSDEQLLPLLEHQDSPVRSAALETLASSYCESDDLLERVFAAWDRHGPAEAFPEFPMLTYLPVSRRLAEESLQRASAMCRDRKIVDPQCRCAGKLIEAYSIASPYTYAGLLDEFERLQGESKIFFRVDLPLMRRRLQIHELTTNDLLANVEASFELEPLEIDPYKLRFAIDELNDREAADALWSRVAEAIAENDTHLSAIIDACLQVLSRRKVEGLEMQLASWLDHDESKIADVAVLALAHARNRDVLQNIAAQFFNYSISGQLRAAVVLQRMRLRGVGETIRNLRADVQEHTVIDALKIAELMQFDFEALEDWLEALLTIDDRSLHRIEQRLHLAIPLSGNVAEDDRNRFLKLFRSRLVAD